jgi:hypothetical protein
MDDAFHHSPRLPRGTPRQPVQQQRLNPVGPILVPWCDRRQLIDQHRGHRPRDFTGLDSGEYLRQAGGQFAGHVHQLMSGKRGHAQRAPDLFGRHIRHATPREDHRGVIEPGHHGDDVRLHGLGVRDLSGPAHQQIHPLTSRQPHRIHRRQHPRRRPTNPDRLHPRRETDLIGRNVASRSISRSTAVAGSTAALAGTPAFTPSTRPETASPHGAR